MCVYASAAGPRPGQQRQQQRQQAGAAANAGVQDTGPRTSTRSSLALAGSIAATDKPRTQAAAQPRASARELPARHRALGRGQGRRDDSVLTLGPCVRSTSRGRTRKVLVQGLDLEAEPSLPAGATSIHKQSAVLKRTPCALCTPGEVSTQAGAPYTSETRSSQYQETGRNQAREAGRGGADELTCGSGWRPARTGRSRSGS